MGKLLHDDQGKEYVAVTKTDLDFSLIYSEEDEHGLLRHVSLHVDKCIATFVERDAMIKTWSLNNWYAVIDVLVTHDAKGKKYLLLRTERMGMPCEHMDFAILCEDDYIFVR